MKRVFFALALILSAFAAQALTLEVPDVVKDGDAPKSHAQFWCNTKTVASGQCETVQVDQGFTYILVHQPGTEQCPAGRWSYINIDTSTGYRIHTKTNTCQGNIYARLFTVDNKMAVVFTQDVTPVEIVYIK